jgi:hypothetical protein
MHNQVIQTQSFDLGQMEKNEAYLLIAQSRSKYRHSASFLHIQRKRSRRMPRDWVGPLPKKSSLKRLKGKERLTGHQWLCDWRTSLQKLGFVCRGELVQSIRSITLDEGLRRKECICLVMGDTAIFLYASIHALPKSQNVDLEPFSNIYHIVRGRRLDSSVGVKRLDSSIAAGILPKANLDERGKFSVEFNGQLFEPDGTGACWRVTTDDNLLKLYGSYRENSPHFRSIRPYQKAGEKTLRLPPPRAKWSIPEKTTIIGFDQCRPKYDIIRKLE